MLQLLRLDASKRVFIVLKCMYFTMISTLNLTPSATATTGRNGHKTLWFYGLVQLVISCPSFLALKT